MLLSYVFSVAPFIQIVPFKSGTIDNSSSGLFLQSGQRIWHGTKSLLFSRSAPGYTPQNYSLSNFVINYFVFWLRESWVCTHLMTKVANSPTFLVPGSLILQKKKPFSKKCRLAVSSLLSSRSPRLCVETVWHLLLPGQRHFNSEYCLHSDDFSPSRQEPSVLFITSFEVKDSIKVNLAGATIQSLQPSLLSRTKSPGSRKFSPYAWTEELAANSLRRLYRGQAKRKARPATRTDHRMP